MNAIKKIVMGLAVASAAVAAQADDIKVIGADETLTVEGEKVYVFSTAGEGKSITINGKATVDLLVVGGGGAGGGHAGSGGGAGGLIHKQDFELEGVYEITVGAGGPSVKGQFQGNNGDNSSFGDLIALGGGGGGGCYTFNGRAGGSGGGDGFGNSTGTAGTGLQPTSPSGGLGNNGGHATAQWRTTGGGGAGGAGSASTGTAGKVAGGAGYECAIVGTNAWYAGGGGGCLTTKCSWSAGANGGGNGGNNSNGTNATTPGSGGGGAGFRSQAPTAYSSGAGADGIVIVRVKNFVPAAAVIAKITSVDVTYDGAEHKAGLTVEFPESYTANWTWSDGTDGYANPEVLVEPGTYTNGVTVSAEGLEPFVGTAEIKIRPIDLATQTTIEGIPARSPGEEYKPTPKVWVTDTWVELTTDDITYEYPDADYTSIGVHTVRIVGKRHVAGDCEKTFVISDGTVHVAKYGSDESGAGTEGDPFATIGHAIDFARNAIDGGVKAMTVFVGAGTYAEKGILLDRPITLVGLGDARGANTEDGVYVNCKTATGEFIFKLDHDSAALENVRIHCSSHDYNTCGYNLYLVKGAVRYCNVTGGTLNQRNAYMTGGRMEDTWISGGNRVNPENPGDAINLYMLGGTASRLKITGGIGGNSVYLSNSAILSDSLITDFSRYNHKSYSSGNKVGHAVIAEGSSVVLNCSIVNNKSPTGTSYEARSAVRLVGSSKAVNCVIYGNLDSAGEDSAFLEWNDSSVAANFVNCAFAKDLAPATDKACIDTVTDAAFKDYEGKDYRPAKGDSVLKGAGTTWEKYLEYGGAEGDTDLDGTPWGSKKLDIGCYAVAKAAGLMLILR